MKQGWIIVSFIVFFVNLNAQDNTNGEKKNLLINNLKKIEDLYFKYLNFSERREALELLDQSLAILKDEKFIISNEATELNDEVFNVLLNDVNSTIMHSEKNEKIIGMAKKVKLSSHQLYKLLENYKFDDDKIKVIKAVYTQINDTENMVLVTPLIENSILRTELEKWIWDR